jgi:hypothetical protein
MRYKDLPDDPSLQTEFRLTVSIKRPHSGAYAVLEATGHGKSGAQYLIALEMTRTPISEDVLSQFETAIFCTLESRVEELAGIQPLLPLT